MMYCPLCREPEQRYEPVKCVACLRSMCGKHLGDNRICYDCLGRKECKPVVNA